MLVTYASYHIQHMQKALEQMNLKLAHVVSDVTGVTGMAARRQLHLRLVLPQEAMLPACAASCDDDAKISWRAAAWRHSLIRR